MRATSFASLVGPLAVGPLDTDGTRDTPDPIGSLLDPTLLSIPSPFFFSVMVSSENDRVVLMAAVAEWDMEKLVCDVVLIGLMIVGTVMYRRGRPSSALECTIR